VRAAARIADEAGAVLVTDDVPAGGWELGCGAACRCRGGELPALAALALLVMRTNASQVSLERRLSRAQNLAAMGRMTATLAHEIRTRSRSSAVPPSGGGSEPEARACRTPWSRRSTGCRRP
jgi:hypothetical protein